MCSPEFEEVVLFRCCRLDAWIGVEEPDDLVNNEGLHCSKMFRERPDVRARSESGDLVVDGVTDDWDVFFSFHEVEGGEAAAILVGGGLVFLVERLVHEGRMA